MKVRRPFVTFSCTPLGAKKGKVIVKIWILHVFPDLYITKGNQKNYNQKYIRQNQNDDTPYCSTSWRHCRSRNDVKMVANRWSWSQTYLKNKSKAATEQEVYMPKVDFLHAPFACTDVWRQAGSCSKAWQEEIEQRRPEAQVKIK